MAKRHVFVRLIAVLLIAISLLGAAATPAVADGTFLFYGTIYRSSGWRPEGITVKVQIPEGPHAGTYYTQTAADGAYSISVPCDAGTTAHFKVSDEYYTDDGWQRWFELYAETFTISPGGYIYLRPHMSLMFHHGRFIYEVRVLQNLQHWPHTGGQYAPMWGPLVSLSQYRLSAPDAVYPLPDCAAQHADIEGYARFDCWVDMAKVEDEAKWLEISVDGGGQVSPSYIGEAFLPEGGLPFSGSYRPNYNYVRMPYEVPTLRIDGDEWRRGLELEFWDDEEPYADNTSVDPMKSGPTGYRYYSWGPGVADGGDHVYTYLSGYVKTEYTGMANRAAEGVRLEFKQDYGLLGDIVERGQATTNANGFYELYLLDYDPSLGVEVYVYPPEYWGAKRSYLATRALIPSILNPFDGLPKAAGDILVAMGDNDIDWDIDTDDMDLTGACFYDQSGEHCDYYDINRDGTINIVDLTYVGANVGREWDDGWQTLPPAGTPI